MNYSHTRQSSALWKIDPFARQVEWPSLGGANVKLKGDTRTVASREATCLVKAPSSQSMAFMMQLQEDIKASLNQNRLPGLRGSQFYPFCRFFDNFSTFTKIPQVSYSAPCGQKRCRRVHSVTQAHLTQSRLDWRSNVINLALQPTMVCLHGTPLRCHILQT